MAWGRLPSRAAPLSAGQNPRGFAGGDRFLAWLFCVFIPLPPSENETRKGELKEMEGKK